MPFKSKSEKIAYIRGFADADGTVGSYGRYNSGRRVALTNTNKDILLIIQKWLKEMGIKSKLETSIQKNPRWKQRYDLTIKDKNNLILFKDIIGFELPKKSMELKRITSNYKESKMPTKKELKTKYDKGLSFSQLANLYGVNSTGTIGYWMKKNGIIARERINQYVTL